MKKNQISRMLSVIFLTAGFVLFLSARLSDPIPVEIQVSPNVLNISSMGTVVTVHTDILYSQVAGASVSLNDVPIDWWKSDDRGYFVAKFNMIAVKTSAGLVLNEYNSLSLTGQTKDGQFFEGSSEILVIKTK